MAIYVDMLQDHSHSVAQQSAQTRRVGARNKNQWCHMWADSEDELHAMAGKLGLKRAWFQEHHRLPHYDLTPGKRAAAIKAGAQEKSLRQALKERYSYLREIRLPVAKPESEASDG